MKRRFRNLNCVKRYLANILNRLDNGEIATDDARVRGYVCSILHKIMLDDELETRIKALEDKLGGAK